MESPDPYPEPTGRSIPPIHTKTQMIQTDPYVWITAGRSIPEFWRNPIYVYYEVFGSGRCWWIWCSWAKEGLISAKRVWRMVGGRLSEAVCRGELRKGSTFSCPLQRPVFMVKRPSTSKISEENVLSTALLLNLPNYAKLLVVLPRVKDNSMQDFVGSLPMEVLGLRADKTQIESVRRESPFRLICWILSTLSSL